MIFIFGKRYTLYLEYIHYLCKNYKMSTQDNYDRGRGSNKPGKNAGMKSMARGNAPLKNEGVPRKTGRQQDPTSKAKPKLKFDKDGKEIGRRPKPVVQVKKSNPAEIGRASCRERV